MNLVNPDSDNFLGSLFVVIIEQTARLVSATDYYPFGMAIHSRSWQSEGYRFGFQGQETDNEWLGGAVSYKYRVHDVRIGRFLSIDPLAPDYPHNSPYAFSENRVIDGVELEGLEYIFYGVKFYQNQGYGITQVGIKHSREIPSIIPGVNISQPLPETHILTAYGGEWVFSSKEKAWKAIHYIQEKHGGEWDSRNNPPGAVMTYGELLSFIDNFEGFFGKVAEVITGRPATRIVFDGKKRNLAKFRAKIREYDPRIPLDAEEGIEFVFDHRDGKFAIGEGSDEYSIHEQLAENLEIEFNQYHNSTNDGKELVGGTLKRDNQGRFITDEQSGHY
ncbi:MAG: hypothetical protein JJT94_01365 [Bernardetiaceae bacterium]|nr:hypothetical protein [Bernardetiaceae bacterium]